MSTDVSPAHELKPIFLYDHLPGILAGYPALLFALFSLLAIPLWPNTITLEEASVQHPVFYRLAEADSDASTTAENGAEGAEATAATTAEAADAATTLSADATNGIVTYVGTVNSHLLFWVGISVMLVWYVAFAFNLPKKRFLTVFGLLGTFVGIPVVLEFTGFIKPFTRLGELLGHFAPEVNSGGWALMAFAFAAIWLGSFVYSRTHLRVKIDESGLTLNQLGGKGERFELIGLKTENEPLDYLELFLAGVGTLSLKTRMNKPIFTMKRVINLYRTWWWPFNRGKLARIEELLSYQGKVIVDHDDRVDMVETAEMEEGLGEEEHKEESTGSAHRSTETDDGEIS